MIKRELSQSILKLKEKMPVLVVTGPRQSGKTTLVKSLFPNYTYYNLEFPDIRMYAKNDPRSFLQDFEKGIIIDEIQYVPELLSYIQGFADQSKLNGKFIITGSQNLYLLQSVSQSLAGRAAIFTLLPFSIAELKHTEHFNNDYLHYLYTGLYPPIYDRALDPTEWLQSYIQTYVERDVRQIVNIKDLSKFQLLIKLCAGRIGQLLNYNALSNEIGIDSKTVKKWISILETSYIIFLLHPYYKNYNKRLVKTPKLYFYDTGLASELLEIKSKEQISNHYAKGALFENMIITNIKKAYFNQGISQNIYFWRNNIGSEIDCVVETAEGLNIFEIKSSKTFHPDFVKGLNYFKQISKTEKLNRYLIYGGDESKTYNGIELISWKFQF